MTQLTAPPQEASAQLVLRKFKGAFKMPSMHINVAGQWQSEGARYHANRISDETGLDPDRVRQIIQLYRVNDVERRLLELVANRREELAKPQLTAEEVRPVIERVAEETGTSAAWLWDRVYPAGSPGRISATV